LVKNNIINYILLIIIINAVFYTAQSLTKGVDKLNQFQQLQDNLSQVRQNLNTVHSHINQLQQIVGQFTQQISNSEQLTSQLQQQQYTQTQYQPAYTSGQYGGEDYNQYQTSQSMNYGPAGSQYRSINKRDADVGSGYYNMSGGTASYGGNQYAGQSQYQGETMSPASTEKQYQTSQNTMGQTGSQYRATNKKDEIIGDAYYSSQGQGSQGTQTYTSPSNTYQVHQGQKPLYY